MFSTLPTTSASCCGMNLWPPSYCRRRCWRSHQAPSGIFFFVGLPSSPMYLNVLALVGMQVPKIGERLRPNNCIATREIVIVAPCDNTCLVADWKHRVLAVHFFKIRINRELMGAAQRARQPIGRALLHMHAALSRHQHAGDECVIKPGADKFTGHGKGKSASIILVLAVHVAVENTCHPYGV